VIAQKSKTCIEFHPQNLRIFENTGRELFTLFLVVPHSTRVTVKRFYGLMIS
jgi:hypothetical protein